MFKIKKGHHIKLEGLTKEQHTEAFIAAKETTKENTRTASPEVGVSEIDFIEPSDDERSQWLEATENYVSGLEDWTFKLLASEKETRSTIQSQQAEIDFFKREMHKAYELKKNAAETYHAQIADLNAEIKHLIGFEKPTHWMPLPPKPEGE